jgi:hypothetical protein
MRRDEAQLDVMRHIHNSQDYVSRAKFQERALVDVVQE